jgi:hypothetical protein
MPDNILVSTISYPGTIGNVVSFLQCGAFSVQLYVRTRRSTIGQPDASSQVVLPNEYENNNHNT